VERVRVLQVYGGVAVDVGRRYHVCLVSVSNDLKPAYIDKSRVKGVYAVDESGWTKYYILYESGNPFYDNFDRKRLPRGAKPANLKVNPPWLRRDGRRYHVWLRELGQWDGPWSLCTATRIYLTNIHPYYGVMD